MTIEWKIAIDDLYILRKICVELRQHGRKRSAVWSLKVAIFEEGHLGCGIPQGVVCLADRGKE